MDDTIRYLNTDLDITSSEDPTALVAAFEAKGVFPLNVTRGEDGLWYATFETDEQHVEPEPNIDSMMEVIESLPEQLRTVWADCTQREFNIGYDCGDKPWAFNQGLSSHLLGRMAAAGASLQITLYPPEHEETGEQVAAPA